MKLLLQINYPTSRKAVPIQFNYFADKRKENGKEITKIYNDCSHFEIFSILLNERVTHVRKIQVLVFIPYFF